MYDRKKIRSAQNVTDVSFFVVDNLANKVTITVGPLARCARHDITLPGHIGTNVMTLGK